MRVQRFKAGARRRHFTRRGDSMAGRSNDATHPFCYGCLAYTTLYGARTALRRWGFTRSQIKAATREWQ